MTGWLVVITIAVVLVVALTPAHHRRTELTRHPGNGTGPDRDRDRAVAEARAAAQQETSLARVAGLLASAGSAVPLHSARIGRSGGPRPR